MKRIKIAENFSNNNNKQKLKKFVIPPSITSIESKAFQNCTSLTEIILPSSLISIGDYSFKECSSLTNIMIPFSVASIGSGIFYKCIMLDSIKFENPSNITSIKKIHLMVVQHCQR